MKGRPQGSPLHSKKNPIAQKKIPVNFHWDFLIQSKKDYLVALISKVILMSLETTPFFNFACAFSARLIEALS